MQNRASSLILLLAVAACGGQAMETDTAEPIARSMDLGPWKIPADTLTVGDHQSVTYTEAGPWTGEEGCATGIASGTRLLRDFIYVHFPQTHRIGGFNCRPIHGDESQMSVHATGRALDIMIYPYEGEANNEQGDPLANWLVENAEAIGIQFIIWDNWTWGASRKAGDKAYGYHGAHPHHDHLHVELTVDKSINTELWFEEDVEIPVIEGCKTIPREGAIIDDSEPCFRAVGPEFFWRVVDGAGYSDSLLWTNAFVSYNPANWARWTLVFEQAGNYVAEVYVDPAWGVHHEVRYTVRHANGEDAVVIDQSAQHGWVSLGLHEFDSAIESWIEVEDNGLTPVEFAQHIAVDAVRLTGSGFDAPTDHRPKAKQPNEASDPLVGEIRDGCSASPPVQRDRSWLFMLLGLGLLVRRQRRPSKSISGGDPAASAV